MGGSCSCSPVKRGSRANTSARPTRTGRVSSRVPVRSRVSVVRPSKKVARYSFFWPGTMSTARVAAPK